MLYPDLFTYKLSLSEIFHSHGFKYQLHAEDPHS